MIKGFLASVSSFCINIFLSAVKQLTDTKGVLLCHYAGSTLFLGACSVNL